MRNEKLIEANRRNDNFIELLRIGKRKRKRKGKRKEKKRKIKTAKRLPFMCFGSFKKDFI